MACFLLSVYNRYSCHYYREPVPKGYKRITGIRKVAERNLTRSREKGSKGRDEAQEAQEHEENRSVLQDILRIQGTFQGESAFLTCLESFFVIGGDIDIAVLLNLLGFRLS